jgi:hypothetical protein
MPVHRRVKPDEQRAACLERFVVGLPVGCAVLLRSRFSSAQATRPSGFTVAELDLCNKALTCP